MKTHLLAYTITTDVHGAITTSDHFEVFCDELDGKTTLKLAEQRLYEIEKKLHRSYTSVTTWNIAEILKTSEHYEIEEDFPSNKISWLETHFQVVNFITLETEKQTNAHTVIKNIHGELGHSGLMELSVQWTKEFETKYAGERWGEEEDSLDWYDTIDAFLIEKNKV